MSVLATAPDAARLIVRDHGIGIAPADQQRIFERFERAAPEREFGGLGLGLWICGQIARALGGTITVESQLGAGATFTVTLPLSGPPTTTSGVASVGWLGRLTAPIAAGELGKEARRLPAPSGSAVLQPPGRLGSVRRPLHLRAQVGVRPVAVHVEREVATRPNRRPLPARSPGTALFPDGATRP